MKKIISLVLFIFFASNLLAQKFEVTSNGLRDSNDLEKSYVVISFDGKSANELFDTFIRYINENRNDAQASIKGQTSNEYLRFSTHNPNFMRWSTGAKASISITYDTELRFKDDRVRVDFVNIKMPSTSSKYSVVFSGNKWTDYCIYDNKGNLYAKKEKQLIEDYFNIQIQHLIKYVQSDNKVDDDW